MTPQAYLEIRRRVIEEGYEHEIEWAQNLTAPKNVDEFANEYIWVVLNSGMKNQIARQIADKVYPALEEGKSSATVFGHKGKTAAIDRFWERRYAIHAAFLLLGTDEERFAFTDPEALKKLMGLPPWIGPITRWHLAKNWGVDCAKPDRHLERIAQHYRTTTHELCARLSKETSDRIATVDLVIWRAANLGLIDTRHMSNP